MIVKLLTMFWKDNVSPPQATLDAVKAFDKLNQALLSAL